MTLASLPSVHDAFLRAARAWPERPMLDTLPGTADVYGIDPGEITYGMAEAAISWMAEEFSDAGYTAGQRVALLLENRPRFFLIWLALNRLGLSVVPINPDLRAAELEYLLGHSEPALVIATGARVADLAAAAQAAGLEAPVIGDGDPVPPPRPGSVVAEDADGGAREAAVLYTSGTTGKPKGCVLSNTYFLMAGDWYTGLDGIVSLREDGERMITPLPVFHMNAMAASFMGMLAVGGCLTVLDRFHPKSWWDDVRAARATCLHYLGVMPSILMKAPEDARDRDHAVRFGFGAGVDPKLHAPFEARFGFPLCEGWAMTETGLSTAITNNRTDRLIGHSSLGIPGPEMELRIVAEDGRDAGTDEPGELWVRRAGPNPRDGFFTRYYKDEAATLDVWDQGWFHTGDIVRRDGQARVFFVDRKKNVIRRSGENIAAVEVESVLMKHPDITAAGVAAVPDAIRGDEVFACLAVSAPSPQKARDIADWALTQMAYYKVPGFIAFVDALPLTPTQKIQRAELKALAARLLAEGAAHDLTHLKKRQVA